MSAPGPITIVMLVCIRDLEAYIAQGWYCGGLVGRHPVQGALRTVLHLEAEPMTALRTLLRTAASMGWHAEYTRGGHLRLRKPGHAPVIISSSPSSRRAEKHTLARLRRHEREQQEQRACLT